MSTHLNHADPGTVFHCVGLFLYGRMSPIPGLHRYDNYDLSHKLPNATNGDSSIPPLETDLGKQSLVFVLIYVSLIIATIEFPYIHYLFGALFHILSSVSIKFLLFFFLLCKVSFTFQKLIVCFACYKYLLMASLGL